VLMAKDGLARLYFRPKVSFEQELGSCYGSGTLTVSCRCVTGGSARTSARPSLGLLGYGRGEGGRMDQKPTMAGISDVLVQMLASSIRRKSVRKDKDTYSPWHPS
jgi:hypothetical protein